VAGEHDGVFAATRPVMHNGSRIGLVYVEASLDELYASTRRLVAFGLVAFLLSMGLAVLLTARLQRAIVTPLRRLSAAMAGVRSVGDYAIRVERGEHDDHPVVAHHMEALLDKPFGCRADDGAFLVQHVRDLVLVDAAGDVKHGAAVQLDE